MSGANELLDSLSEGDVMTFTANPASEGHIVIGTDRFITVPEELKRIAVQHDHNIETVTFDCPRYWDEHDLTEMAIYINYRNANAVLGAFRAENVTVDPDDSNMIHFTWTISGNVTTHKGSIVFLVCAKTVNTDTGEEVLHWNSEINKDTYVSEGLEAVATTYKSDTDLYTQLLQIVDSAEILDVLGTGVNSERHNGVPKENASGDNSFVQGRGTIARGVNQHARGRFNVADTANKYADIVGNGTSDSDRSNAYTLDWDGNAEYAGGIKAKGVDILNELDKHNNREVEVVVDDTVAYQKEVPANSLPNAKVTRIGGMTRKCTNLIPYPYENSSKTSKGITYTVNDDGSVHIKGTCTAQSDFLVQYNTPFTLPAGTYVISGNNDRIGALYASIEGIGIVYSTGNGTSFTLTKETPVRIAISVYEGNTVDKTVYPMLNKGTTALPYEPYFEGLRSAPVSAMDSAGANIIPFPYVGGASKTSNGVTFTVNPDGGIRIAGTNTHTTYVEYPLITTNSKVFDYDNITVSLYGSTSADIYVTVGGGGWSFGEVKAGTSTILTNSRTTNVFSYALVRVKAGATVSATVYPMLNKGATALPYTQYFKDTIEIPEAVRALGGYGWSVSEDVYNYIDYDKEQFVKRVDKVIFDGTEGWVLDVSNVFGYKELGHLGDAELGQCSHFTNDGVISTAYMEDKTVSLREAGYAYFKDTGVSTVDEWKELLAEWYASGTPLTLVYVLAEPIITDISGLLSASSALKVESGGTVTMVNEHGYEVPSTIHFYTSKDVQEVIGAEEIVGNLVGNASTADKLSGARTITLSGDVEGTAEFDGGTDITINTTVKNLTHTHNNATESAAGFMSAVDAKYLAKVRTGDIGNFSGKTLGDLQTALLTWVSTRANYPNATAVFSCETIQNIWNAGDTSATFNAGAQWTVRLETSFGGTNYCQLYFSRYFDKDVYMAALSNGNWQKMRKLAFTDEMTNHRNIFVLDGVPTDLSAYSDGDIIMVKES